MKKVVFLIEKFKDQIWVSRFDGDMKVLKKETLESWEKVFGGMVEDMPAVDEVIIKSPSTNLLIAATSQLPKLLEDGMKVTFEELE